MQFNNYKQRHYNGQIFGKQLYWLNNRSKQNAINTMYKNYGRVLRNDLSMPNPYYKESSNLQFNPGTKGLRMVTPPVDNSKHIDKEQVKPSNFGKTANQQENNVIHKNINAATNSTAAANVHH